MMNKKIIILGAGLSGLLTAYRLQNKGFDIEIIEARNRIGGRIHSVKSGEAIVEMGATWFNDVHKNFRELLSEFEIDFFEQFMQGTSYYETASNAPAQIIEIPNDNSSYRVVGGTSQLIEKIQTKLKEVKIHLNKQVTALDFTAEKAEIITNKQTFVSDFIISTIPQPIFVSTIKFAPNLPENLINTAQNTHTWMQDSIKVALIYKTPFWRNQAISGTFFSAIGPITEFYDQSTFDLNGFALCGFMHSGFNSLEKEERKSKVLNQLQKIFGNQALEFLDYQETIWSNEEFTKYSKQENFIFPHQNNGNANFRKSYFENRLFLSGTETASQFPGYMEGAIISADEVVRAVLNF